jgi:hypothetical protein
MIYLNFPFAMRVFGFAFWGGGWLWFSIRATEVAPHWLYSQVAFVVPAQAPKDGNGQGERKKVCDCSLFLSATT